MQLHVAFPSLPFPESLALNPAASLPPRVRHARAQEAPVLFSDVPGAGGVGVGVVPACVRPGGHVPAPTLCPLLTSQSQLCHFHSALLQGRLKPWPSPTAFFRRNLGAPPARW